MIGTTNTSPRRVAIVALVAAVVAALASPALADPLLRAYEQPTPANVRPDDRAGVLGPGVAPQSAVQHSVRPDDRAGIRGLVTQSRVLRVLHPGVATSGSFDWNDALIGAGVAIGALALLLFTAVALRRHAGIATAAAAPGERTI
jgi:hypothetical protein